MNRRNFMAAAFGVTAIAAFGRKVFAGRGANIDNANLEVTYRALDRDRLTEDTSQLISKEYHEVIDGHLIIDPKTKKLLPVTKCPHSNIQHPLINDDNEAWVRHKIVVSPKDYGLRRRDVVHEGFDIFNKKTHKKVAIWYATEDEYREAVLALRGTK